MASGTLYTYQGSFRANKILIAAAYSGANVTVDPNFEYGKTNTSAEFLKKFPLGKVPAFESNGTYLSESDAIAHFVSNEALLGGCCRSAQAAVREYISFAENEILPSACTWVYPTLGFKQYNKQDTEKSQQHIKACLDKLNKDLLTKTFLVGERITLADVTLCTTLVMLYIQVLEPKFRDSYPNVNRWFITCVNQPNFKKVLGDVKLCEKMAVFDNKRYQELHPKGGKDKKEQKPKAEKKEKKKPQEKNEEPAAESKPKEKKACDYFAHVPKSAKFDFDYWKRCYSNDDHPDCVDVLLDTFDSDSYSIWYGKQSYHEDLVKNNKQKFSACNVINGFLQRVEPLRKHAFGLMMAHEETEPERWFSISGVWIFQGKDLAFSLNADWNVDAEYFDFRKLDLDIEEDKKMLADFLREGRDMHGRECADFKEIK